MTSTKLINDEQEVTRMTAIMFYCCIWWLVKCTGSDITYTHCQSINICLWLSSSANPCWLHFVCRRYNSS